MADEIEIKVPSLGESETEATLVSWLKQEGDAVAVDDVIAEIESDKITLEVTALEDGVLKRILKQAGEVVEPGEVIGYIEPGVRAERKPQPATQASANTAPGHVEPARAPVAPPKKQPETSTPKVMSTQMDAATERSEERVPMSGLRKRIATRLKQAQDTAAMLTTFNEVNMQPVLDLRKRFGAAFAERHGIKLGLMSFFVQAVAQAMAKYPALNAYIDGDEIVYHNYLDVGIAVSTERGLVVPVLRNAEKLSLAEIERQIADLARRAREGGLLPDDLKGGTFSITNGGVFGSLLSTPILNPPQSGILGMHTIQKRPVVEDDDIVIRPMMYLALTYDHRLIDGAEAVRFLVSVKEALEYPASLHLNL
ncbi:MAG: dihydrolipoyllysine-residue succinyltransferase [Zetaproteobacteria bacterium]|nr:MAG: dihydrolipoyllysine-residue succinyltransferase [Zetaproteobacteria bacterium]